MPLEIVIIGYFTVGKRPRFFIHKLCKTNERGREQNSKINISLFYFNEKHRAVKCLTVRETTFLVKYFTSKLSSKNAVKRQS